MPSLKPSIWALLLVGVAATTAARQDYTVDRYHYSVEYRHHLDANLMREAANLLLSGEKNERELIRRAKHESGEKQRAVLAVMLYSGDPKFLTVLLPLAGSKLHAFASEAVTNLPQASWPILWRLAEKGNAGVVQEIVRYRGMREKALERLFKSKFPDVRERAVGLGWENTERAVLALSDPDWGVCRAGVRVLLINDKFDANKLYFHKIDRVRVFAAELSQRNTRADLFTWARIARDRHPDVRYWAMYMLGSASLTYGDVPGRKEAVDSVAAAIAKGPSKVRKAAVHAIRGWLYEAKFEKWKPSEIAAVMPILKTQLFRDALYFQRKETGLGMPASQYGVTMTSVPEALAIAGDPRALVELRRAMEESSDDKLVLALAYLPSETATAELRGLLTKAIHGGPIGIDSSLHYLFRAMSRVDGSVPSQKIIDWIDDPSINSEIRTALIVQGGYADDREINQFILDRAAKLDRTAMLGLIGVDDPRAEALLVELTKSEDVNMRNRARAFLENWRDIHRNK